MAILTDSFQPSSVRFALVSTGKRVFLIGKKILDSLKYYIPFVVKAVRRNMINVSHDFPNAMNQIIVRRTSDIHQ